jgi:hypothetical protein
MECLRARARGDGIFRPLKLQKLQLQQGQVWKRGEEFLRIVELHRLEVKYKAMTDLQTRDGVHHHVTKKEFCRLIKGAELMPSQSDISSDAAGHE